MNRQQQITDASIQRPPVGAPARARQATPTSADTAEHHNERAILLARSGRFDEAAVELQTAIAIRPGYAKAHNNLGIVYAHQHRLADAGAAFRAALAYRPNMAEPQNNLGNILAMQGRLDDAIACYRRATGLKPGYVEAYNNLGIACAEQGNHADSVAAFAELLRLTTGRADLPTRQPVAQNFPAAASVSAVLAPTLDLASVKRPRMADPHLAAMAFLLESAQELPENTRIALHFALGKAHDDANAPDRAFPHFLEGNILKRRSLLYDEAAVLAAMEHARRGFDTERINALRGQGDASAAPIFILGMPKSGGTLLAHMLAAHPDIFAAGERSDFSRLARAIPAPEAATPETLRQLGSDYLTSINAKTRRHARVIDTMPGNVLHAGLIHLALPNARIIHTRRGAADTCFSCYARLFRIGHEYSFDLAELGRYYRGYAQLMEHWRSVLPASVLIEIDYEALVADPRGQIARILDHCALPWSESCLRHPLHGRSIGRWQRYAAYLAPLLGELQKDVLF